MRMITTRIWNEGEYHYEGAFGFIPKITCYIHEDNRKRPGMLIVPGGGYYGVAPSEGEVAARKFYEMGYQAFVLTYTVNFLEKYPLKKQPLQDISRAVRYIRKETDTYQVLSDKIVVCGFSAGGHLCASLCVHYEDVVDPRREYQAISNRPDAAILSYPVISTGKAAEAMSFVRLLGKEASKEELQYMSVENYVTKNTPPTFLWATVTDELVPVDNSILYAESCRKNQVPYSIHLFSTGRHGMSVVDETWCSRKYENRYTEEQIDRIKEAAGWKQEGEEPQDLRIADKEISRWPELACDFLEKVLH